MRLAAIQKWSKAAYIVLTIWYGSSGKNGKSKKILIKMFNIGENVDFSIPLTCLNFLWNNNALSTAPWLFRLLETLFQSTHHFEHAKSVFLHWYGQYTKRKSIQHNLLTIPIDMKQMRFVDELYRRWNHLNNQRFVISHK